MALAGKRWLRVTEAARVLGVSPSTIRRWERAGKFTSRRIGARQDRLFDRRELERMVSGIDSRCVALYVRVSGSTGQETSLFAQERELRAALSASVEVTVFTDRESGLNEHRRGLTRLRRDVAKGVFAEVWVTHEDRLTRFGVDFLRAEFAAHGVELRVLHEREDASPEQELLDDFMSLLASFSGRVYGQRSAAARCRLVEAANAGKASGK